MSTSPQEGDWVLAWGQVMGVDEKGIHPEDVVVEFFSHNTQWSGHIRKDRVRPSEVLPDFVTACTALFMYAGGENGLFVRCALHDGHGVKHQDSAGTVYEESHVIGYIEEKTG